MTENIKQFWGTKPRRHNSPRLQAILQNHSHQDSVVLVPKQTDRPMEQNGEPRNKPRHLWSINLWQRRKELNGKKSFQQVLLGNLDSCMQINGTRTHPHTTHTNKLKVAKRLKYKSAHHPTPRREHRQNILWHQPYEYFLRSVSQIHRNKRKDKPVVPNHTDKLLHSKGNLIETKKTAYRMEENSCKWCNG